MSNFVDNTLTDAGAALLSEVLLGAKLQPTKIVMGSGFIPSGQTSKTLTNVVTPEVTLEITKKVRVDATHVEVGGVYNNQDVTEAFYFRELALYCKAVKDDGTVLPEVMYSYGNAGNSADLMVPYTSGAAIEKQIDLITYVGNDTNVDLTISSGTYITMADLQDALKDLKAGSGIPPNDMQEFTAASTESGINLTFTGPKNSYLYGAAAADTLACVPAGVMIRYKEGGYPVDMEDGALVGDFSINPVAPESTEKEVIGLTFGNTYYFTAFPYSTEGVYNKSQADANHAMAMWSGNKGTINVNVQAYEGFEGVIGDYTITLVDQAADNPQNVEQYANGPGITQIGNLEAGKTYVVTLSDTSTLMADPSEPINIVAGTSYNVDMTYRRKYGTISVNVSTASDFAELGEYTITLVHQEDGYEDVVKTATGKGVTVFDSLVDGRKYKVRLGNTPNFLPPADSSVYTIVGGENIDVNMTYSAAMGNVQINVATNPAGMPIGGYTISLIPVNGGSTLSKNGNGPGAITFNNVPLGDYTVSGTGINHYRFNGSTVYVSGGQTEQATVTYSFNASFNESSWAEIQAVSASGQAASFYNIGDIKNNVTVKKYDLKSADNQEASGSATGTGTYNVLLYNISSKGLHICTLGFPLRIAGGWTTSDNEYGYYVFGFEYLNEFLDAHAAEILPEAYQYLKATKFSYNIVLISTTVAGGGYATSNNPMKISIPPAGEFSSGYFTTNQRRKLNQNSKYALGDVFGRNTTGQANVAYREIVLSDGSILNNVDSYSLSQTEQYPDTSTYFNSPICFVL